MKFTSIKSFLVGGTFALLVAFALQAQADITFKFEQFDGTVTMTSSGVLDTTNLVPSDLPDGWGGTGTEHNSNPGDIDIMGGTSFGGINAQFRFHPGTDASAITNPGGPFADSNFSVESIQGSKSFTTYSGFEGGFRIPGIGVNEEDIVDGLWAPDQLWTYPQGATLASLNLVPGTYAVSDSETGETITIHIVEGELVPVPTLDTWALSLLLASVILMGGWMVRRRNMA